MKEKKISECQKVEDIFSALLVLHHGVQVHDEALLVPGAELCGPEALALLGPE